MYTVALSLNERSSLYYLIHNRGSRFSQIEKQPFATVAFGDSYKARASVSYYF